MFLQLEGSPGDATEWENCLVREGWIRDEWPAVPTHAASRWRSPAGGSPPDTVTVARIAPVQGRARDIAVFRPGRATFGSFSRAPDFFNGPDIETGPGVYGPAKQVGPYATRELRGIVRTRRTAAAGGEPPSTAASGGPTGGASSTDDTAPPHDGAGNERHDS